MKTQKNEHSKKFTRRDFIKGSTLAAAGISIVPRHVLGGIGYKAPSDTLNIAGIGVGGMGRSNLRHMQSENIIALCDVDWKYAQRCFEDYPDAKKFKDYRKMFDEMKNDIDAVIIATPDHAHAMIAVDAMQMGKHVYLQKPLTHTVYESRVLTKVAKETGVVTQMGNQGNSSNDIRKICEWIWNGEIGEVEEAYCWTNRPIWPQGLERPSETPSLPPTLAWDLFIGPAPWRPYHPAYTPWNWRAWWDFGTGALGDMGCHIIDPVFKALRLGYPKAFEASSTEVNTESAPVAEKVTLYFPEREKYEKVKMPAVKLTWFDGGLLPDRPEGIEPGKILGDGGGGAMFKGSKGTLICSTYAKDPYIIGRENNPPKESKELRRVEDQIGKSWNEGAHEMDWIRACKEDPDNRVMPSSNFAYAGPFNETVVMGNLAVRLQDLKKTLEWDADNMRITNISDSDEIRVVTTNEFKVVDGDPRFMTNYATINAKEAAEEYVKHKYRDGWKLNAKA